MIPTEIEGYTLEMDVGGGATSRVYRVTRGSERFALKWMTERREDEALDVLLQFRQEAAAMARLEHPSLVRVFEIGEHQGRPFIVMDFLDGESVEQRLQQGPLSEAETVRIGRAIAAALMEVHRIGLIHRDVKPANIFLTHNGAIKLLDFGLVCPAGAMGQVGTLGYAPLEQLGVIKRGVEASSDLYSLGVSLFECLTGRLPIPTDASAFLHRLATELPPDVRSLRPEVSPALAAILARLLAKDPDDRYRRARGLLADFDRLEALNEEAAHGAVTLGVADPAWVQEQDHLVGRDAEMASLLGHLQQTGRAVLVEGEEGSGKTRLLQELESRAVNRLVLSGRCQRGETVPFGPLREALDQYLQQVFRLPEEEKGKEIEQIRRAAGPYAILVKRLSAGLGRILVEAPELRALDPDAEQQRYYEGLASFFRTLGTASRPVVLLIDDVQWLDEGSLRVISRIFGETTSRLLLVGTVRNLPATQGMVEQLLRALGSHLLEKIILRPLSRPAVSELISSRLGGKPLDDAFVDRLNPLTRGNPFAIAQAVRALLEKGALRPVAGRWVADPRALDGATLSKNVREMMEARMAGLTPTTARILGVAGLIGLRFPLGLLAEVTGLSGEPQKQAMMEGLGADLLEAIGDDRFAFVHESLREAAVAYLSGPAQTDAHQAIGEALDAQNRPENLYAIARHFALGHVSRDPRRACERNLAAGLAALEEHANEEAFILLDRARELALSAGILEEVAPRLLEGLGRACAMTGRLEAAFGHLREALKRAESQQDRFRLQNLLTLSYASQGQNDEALASLYEAFRVIGQPYPSNTVVQILTMLWAAVLGNVLMLTGIGYGRAKAEDRERRTILSQLHYTGSMIALFQGKPVLMGQFIIRDLLNVHFLGVTGDAAITNSVYGAVLGLAGLSRMVEYYCNRGIRMSEQLGDQAALSVCRAYHAVGTKWAGDLKKGNQMLVDALPQLDRHVPGSWYQAMMITEQAYSLLHGGLTTAAIEHIRNSIPQLDRTNNLMFRYNTLSVLYCQLMVSGAVAEAQPLWVRLEKQFQPLSRTVYVGLARCIASLEVLVDNEETGAAVDEQIAGFQQLLSEDYYSNAARVLACYARLNQLYAAKGDERVAARKRFEQEVAGLRLRAMVPVFQANVFLFRAVLSRMDKDYSKAKRLLAEAEQRANRCGSRRAAFQIALESARLSAELGESVSGFYAQQALEIALTERWRQKVRRVRQEFGLKEEKGGTAARTGSLVAGSLNHGQRYADALLQVSLASGSTLDPDAQAQNALVELAKVLGAERAIFFLLTENDTLQLKARTGIGTEHVSQTVVRKVLQTRAPVILTGTEEGEAAGSDSIVAGGLRSIIAAPLMIRERMIGVVYLDSRLAKAMFTVEDVSLLMGISNHIAIAVETARIARLEAGRAAMARDLEILRVVQNLLLPSESVFEVPGLKGASFYQAATQCGGDWWWYQPRPNGSTLLLLGDVSGHGAGPAMLTSSVAGAFHMVCALFPDATPPEILAHLHREVRRFKGYHMTMSIAMVDPATRTLSWWNAAGPEVYLLQRGKCTVLNAAGTTLGTSDTFSVGTVSVPIAPGDRLLMCTDGVLELRRNGRMLGNRQTSKMFLSFSNLPIADACAGFGAELNALLAQELQEDDITFLMVEFTEWTPTMSNC